MASFSGGQADVIVIVSSLKCKQWAANFAAMRIALTKSRVSASLRRVVKPLVPLVLLAGGVASTNSAALALAPEEFTASRQLACILAQQSLGQLSEDEYGEMTHNLLDDFEESERDAILAKALGYYDGLMFSIDSGDSVQVDHRLADFVNSQTCASGYQKVTFSL